MKKKIYYGIILVVIFLIVLAVLFFLPKKDEEGEEKNVTFMSEATLPVIYPYYGDIRINPLHGYVSKMDTMAMRDTLTPLEEDRQLKLGIDTFGTRVEGISYEVRSLDMERILENTAVKDWETAEDIITTVLSIENLLTEEEEYSLTIKLLLEDGREVSYYTRIVWGIDNVNEKLSYVLNFNTKTFDKEEALELVPYLESGSKGDNTNYGHVNIYSSFQQITWGNLKVEAVSDVNISLKEINGNISYFLVEYYISSENMYGTEELYKVKEYYRTRYTSTRTYLLSFERTMEQYFTAVSENVYGSRINLGITGNADSGIIEAAECPSGKITCFVKNGELWKYRAAENTFTKVFSFADENADIRTLWDKYDIKIADIDNDGNIIFLVYGYMSRGKHEGRIGVSVYRYTEEDKAAAELVYIPYDKQFAMLKESVGAVCYVNSSNWLYFLLEEKLYSLDLASREYTVVFDGLQEGSYVVNASGDTIVWQRQAGDGTVKEIKLLNLESSKEKSITCAEDEVMQLIGYMDGDIVYGVTRTEDIVTDVLGKDTAYMYKLCIINEEKIQVGSYQKENVYIEEAVISEGMITLNRFEKTEDGSFLPIEVDYLTSNVSESRTPLSLSVIVTELKKKEIWLNISGSKGESRLLVDGTEAVYFEDNKEVPLATGDIMEERYFVYTKGEYRKSFGTATEAIALADEEQGIVTDIIGRYIWKRGNVYTSRNLSGILMQPDEENTLAACMDAVLKNVGIITSSKAIFNEGGTIADVFEKNEGYDCLYLDGAELSQVLYCVNAGKPVIGKISEEEYVVITGYDSKNVTLLSAVTGSTYKQKIEVASELFKENGNIFISYLEQ